MNRLLVALTLAVAVQAAVASAQTVACDVKLNVTDQDPAGLNIRASPGGAIVGALKAKGRWVQVHVTAQRGEWARIDQATDINEESGEGKPVFRGVGFAAFSKLSNDSLNEIARIQAAPSDSARTILKILQSEQPHPTEVTVLGCSGVFLKVQLSTIVGWTRNFCSNRLTTCV
jgi:hypothetical protein